jgi:hypothetical protein
MFDPVTNGIHVTRDVTWLRRKFYPDSRVLEAGEVVVMSLENFALLMSSNTLSSKTPVAVPPAEKEKVVDQAGEEVVDQADEEELSTKLMEKLSTRPMKKKTSTKLIIRAMMMSVPRLPDQDESQGFLSTLGKNMRYRSR